MVNTVMFNAGLR
ncbi:hypothetical protein VCEDC020_001800A, partial [Vibrio cholerae O1 str. EDC-020]